MYQFIANIGRLLQANFYYLPFPHYGAQEFQNFIVKFLA